jgi:hypothetical protein
MRTELKILIAAVAVSGFAMQAANAHNSNSGLGEQENTNLNLPNTASAPYVGQAQMSEPEGRGPHHIAITDEYGFKYDSRGNRLDANGYVISPHTP